MGLEAMINRNVLIDRLAAAAEAKGKSNEARRLYREQLHGMRTVALGDLYKAEIKDDPYSPKAEWKPTAAAA